MCDVWISVIAAGEADSESPVAVLHCCYLPLSVWKLLLCENRRVCSVSRRSKQLWHKLLQSFCAAGILLFNCTVMIPSGNKLKAGGEKSNSTKTEHSRCILLFKVRMCFSRDTFVLTFWENCGIKLLCQVDLLWTFNWFESVVEDINTVLVMFWLSLF